MKIIIEENQRGFLFKNGKFSRMLEPGKNKYYPIFGESVKTLNATGAVYAGNIEPKVFTSDEAFNKSVARVEVPENNIAIKYADGRIDGTLPKGEWFIWNIFQKHKFKFLDMSVPETANEVPKAELKQVHASLYTKIEVPDGCVALLYIDGKYTDLLKAGVYCYWNSLHKITCKLVDLRVRLMSVGGQEILTADRVSLRINFALNFKITDPVKSSNEIADMPDALYSFVQMTLREYVGRFRFDELLKQKENVSSGILEKLKEKEKTFYISISEAGIKDIILPGEIREIMNGVLIAEKAAQASVITRREEIASTRSLLETAKLMEENSLLFKLKEMEYIERICDKVGNISLGGDNVLEGLRKLVSETNKPNKLNSDFKPENGVPNGVPIEKLPI